MFTGVKFEGDTKMPASGALIVGEKGSMFQTDDYGGSWKLLSSTTTGGYSGLSVYGTGANTRIALGVSNTWGDGPGHQIIQMSDNAGSTWREISAQMPHTPAGNEY